MEKRLGRHGSREMSAPHEPSIGAMPPTVSVVLPVYNGERYVREAIDSVLTQTFRDFELLIIDDEPHIRQMMRMTLEAAGYQVEIAAPADASKEAAAIEAAYHMLVYLFPDLTGTLTTQYNSALAVIPNGAAKTAGMQAGQAAATLIIALRTGRRQI